MMIEDYQFGSMRIAGKTYQSDLKIVQGRIVSSWWRSEGHSVGVADVDDILAAKPEILVVGMGQPGRMRVAEPLHAALLAAGIKLIEEPTAAAIQSFNRLDSEGKEVAGAFHLTC